MVIFSQSSSMQIPFHCMHLIYTKLDVKMAIMKNAHGWGGRPAVKSCSWWIIPILTICWIVSRIMEIFRELLLAYARINTLRARICINYAMHSKRLSRRIQYFCVKKLRTFFACHPPLLRALWSMYENITTIKFACNSLESGHEKFSLVLVKKTFEHATEYRLLSLLTACY